MKLSELLEEENVPFNVKMLQKLLDKGEKVYIIQFGSKLMHASRIVDADYLPPKGGVGGGLTLRFLIHEPGEELSTRKAHLVQSPLPDGAERFEREWTLRKVDGRWLFHIASRRDKVDNLKDEMLVIGQM